MKKKITSWIVCLSICFCIYQPVLADDYYESEPFFQVYNSKINKKNISKNPVIEASSAIVIDSESGRVLYQKNAYSKRPMASTTKIMTAIVAIENGELDDVVTVSKRAAAVGGSTIGIKQGDKYKLKELLYGLMLNSGNDAAIAIAEHIGGSVEDFALMMNNKAASIGAKNTNFKSPHGLDMDGHYSTAYDLAIIAKYALQNKEFSRIVGTKTSSIPKRQLSNTNEMLSIYPGADGVKTGYTGKAGRCLVSSATRDDFRIISVVLNCSSRTTRAHDSMNILDYVFSEYKPYTLLKSGDIVGSVEIIKGKKSIVNLQSVEGIYYPLKNDEIDKVYMKMSLPQRLKAPVFKGVEVGTATYYLNGEAFSKTALKACEDSQHKSMIDYLYDIFRSYVKLVKQVS